MRSVKHEVENRETLVAWWIFSCLRTPCFRAYLPSCSTRSEPRRTIWSFFLHFIVFLESTWSEFRNRLFHPDGVAHPPVHPDAPTPKREKPCGLVLC